MKEVGDYATPEQRQWLREHGVRIAFALVDPVDRHGAKQYRLGPVTLECRRHRAVIELPRSDWGFVDCEDATKHVFHCLGVLADLRGKDRHDLRADEDLWQLAPGTLEDQHDNINALTAVLGGEALDELEDVVPFVRFSKVNAIRGVAIPPRFFVSAHDELLEPAPVTI